MVMNCLYCGKKLGWVCDTKYVIDSAKAPHVCGSVRYRHMEYGSERFTCKSKHFDRLPAGGGWRCRVEECRAIHEGQRRLASRKHLYEKRGPNGDGFFCSKTHGWKFGCLAGAAGYRRKAKVT